MRVDTNNHMSVRSATVPLADPHLVQRQLDRHLDTVDAADLMFSVCVSMFACAAVLGAAALYCRDNRPAARPMFIATLGPTLLDAIFGGNRRRQAMRRRFTLDVA